MTTLRANKAVDILVERSLDDDLLIVNHPLTYYWFKRFFDIVVAFVLIMALLPVLVITSILIKLDSRGSVIFVQERVGSKRVHLNGRQRWVLQNFKIYKFRSMAADADQSLHQKHIQAYVAAANGAIPGSDTAPLKATMSVTRVGRIIRKTSIDELPQLFNVLKGEMSLVGPRPVPTYEVAEYRLHHYQRFSAMPGITGLWQVKGRCSTTFEEQMYMDAEYIRNQSTLLDFIILLQTIPAVISGRGAA